MTRLSLPPLVLVLLALGVACNSPESQNQADPHAGQDHAAEAEPVDDHPDHPGHSEHEETSMVSTAPVADWCAGHGVPESQCTICNPGLAAQYRESGDWCLEHSLPESVCPLCGHGVAPPEGLAARDWCTEHGVPETSCVICNPELIPEFQASGDWCAEHAVPESLCRLCGNGYPNSSVSGLVIRFKDEDRERAAGLRTRPAGSCLVAHEVEAPARIDHDRNSLSQVTAQLGGFVREIGVDLGDTVSAGVELFVIDSLQLAEARRAVGPARSRVALARERVKRERLLDERGIGSLSAVERAQVQLADSRATLGQLEARLAMAGPPVDGEGTYSVRAAIGGTVVERPAVLGSPAEPGTMLALLADVHSAWAWADVQPEFASQLEEGLPAEVSVTGAPPLLGEITWISPRVDERTRTVAVRIQLDDPDDLVRLNQYGVARLSLEESDSRPVVPSEALQQVEDELVVFVNTAPLTYETRVVTTGYRRDGGVEVDGAIGPGDPIVTVGAYLLKTELLRDSIGAGCCEVDSIEGK